MQPVDQTLVADARLRADVANVLTALRLAGLRGKEAFLTQQYGAPQPLPLFLGPGRLSVDLLLAAARQKAPDLAIELLLDCYLGEALRQAQAPLKRDGRLSVVEKQLRQFLLQRSLSLYRSASAWYRCLFRLSRASAVTRWSTFIGSVTGFF